MIPDYQKAAIRATETLIQHQIGTAPIDPLPILKKTPGVIVLSFEEMSKKTNIDRKQILDTFGCSNQDAVTTVFVDGDELKYVVTYNRMLSSSVALWRENSVTSCSAMMAAGRKKSETRKRGVLRITCSARVR